MKKDEDVDELRRIIEILAGIQQEIKMQHRKLVSIDDKVNELAGDYESSSEEEEEEKPKKTEYTKKQALCELEKEKSTLHEHNKQLNKKVKEIEKLGQREHIPVEQIKHSFHGWV